MFSARARQRRSLLRVSACLILVLALTMGPAAVARWETRTEQQCSPTQVCQDIAKQVPDCRTETVCRQVPVTTQRCTNVPVCQMVTQYRQNCVPVRGSNVPRCSNVPYQQQVCTPRQNCVPVTTQQQQCTPQQKCTTKTVSTKQCRSEQKCTTVTRQVWVPDPAPAAPPAAGAGQKAGGAPPPALPRVPSQQGNTLSPAQQQELARIKQQAEEIQAKLNAYQRQQQQAPVAGGGQKAIATPSHAPSAHQINPQPVPAQAAAGQPAFKSLGSAAGSPASGGTAAQTRAANSATTTPAFASVQTSKNVGTQPSPVEAQNFKKLQDQKAKLEAELQRLQSRRGPQVQAAKSSSGDAPSAAFKPIGTAGNARIEPDAPKSSGSVRAETADGQVYTQTTPSRHSAMGDKSSGRKFGVGTVPTEANGDSNLLGPSHADARPKTIAAAAAAAAAADAIPTAATVFRGGLAHADKFADAVSILAARNSAWRDPTVGLPGFARSSLRKTTNALLPGLSQRQQTIRLNQVDGVLTGAQGIYSGYNAYRSFREGDRISGVINTVDAVSSMGSAASAASKYSTVLSSLAAKHSIVAKATSAMKAEGFGASMSALGTGVSVVQTFQDTASLRSSSDQLDRWTGNVNAVGKAMAAGVGYVGFGTTGAQAAAKTWDYVWDIGTAIGSNSRVSDHVVSRLSKVGQASTLTNFGVFKMAADITRDIELSNEAIAQADKALADLRARKQDRP